MDYTCSQTLFSNLTANEEAVLIGGWGISQSLTSNPTMSLGLFAPQGSAQGAGGSSNGVVVDMNLSAVLVSAFVGRFFGLRGNALSWYMLMNSVSLRWL